MTAQHAHITSSLLVMLLQYPSSSLAVHVALVTALHSIFASLADVESSGLSTGRLVPQFVTRQVNGNWTRYTNTNAHTLTLTRLAGAQRAAASTEV